MAVAVQDASVMMLGRFLPSAGRRFRVSAGQAEVLHYLVGGPLTLGQLAVIWLKGHERNPLTGRVRTLEDAVRVVEGHLELLHAAEAVFAERSPPSSG
ncbi:MAG TPA: hypothetical protein ENK57_23485 [Polyangiaceae bacterium]|nr:hypothetical protein [Polyangiaceae bacterium]